MSCTGSGEELDESLITAVLTCDADRRFEFLLPVAESIAGKVEAKLALIHRILRAAERAPSAPDLKNR
jgi:hypothetical protein